MEAWLRTLIQQLKNIVFIFSGSQPHLMNEMFANPSKPFFRSTVFLQLEKINFDAYLGFIMQKFAESDMEIKKEVLLKLLSKFEVPRYYKIGAGFTHTHNGKIDRLGTIKNYSRYEWRKVL